MYDKTKNIAVPSTTSAQVKNLQVTNSQIAHLVQKNNYQVVSFDAEWREVYVGYVRKDVFTGILMINN